MFHGREGSEQIQLPTTVHLRAGLTGAAYEAAEAVRKMTTSDRLKTKDGDSKPSQAGVKLLLDTLPESAAAEALVKVKISEGEDHAPHLSWP